MEMAEMVVSPPSCRLYMQFPFCYVVIVTYSRTAGCAAHRSTILPRRLNDRFHLSEEDDNMQEMP